MSIAVFKAIAVAAVLLTGLLGGMVAILLSGSKRSARFFSLGNAFSGGVFLGAGFIHMLPDAVDGFASSPGCSGYPWAFLLCACGFCAVLLLERVMLGAHDEQEHSEAPDQPAPSAYPYILTLVLSVHSMIAGIALGAEETVIKAFVILFAIVAHKGSAAFALGVSLCRGGIPKKRAANIIALFCLSTPIGIVLGSTLRAMMTGGAEQVFESVFDGLAAGTFRYVASLEVTDEEFSEAHGR
ncbi:MAG: ZIP family metal transporter [bacterium]|nr:ZIP family metal transporter [bacterium]